MTQTMGQIIKNLRKEHGFTQDDLAEKLNISPQAVSRWENEISMPDISQILPIAALFEVSTDVLFGLNAMGADAEIEEAIKIARLPDTDNNRCIDVWSDLLKKYPRSNRIRKYLAHAYLCRAFDDDYAKAAELYEKILDESTDGKQRLQALSMLCFCYNRNGDMKNAIRVAELCGPSHITKDALLAKIDGYDKHNEVNQRLLSHSVTEAVWCIMRQRYSSNDDTILAHRTALRLLDSLYYNGDEVFGDRHIYIYLRSKLCRLLAKAERYDELYEQLSLWLDEVIFEDSLSPDEYGYENNILLNTQKYKYEVANKPDFGKEYMASFLGTVDFDTIRESERFKAFCSRAETKYKKR